MTTTPRRVESMALQVSNGSLRETNREWALASACGWPSSTFVTIPPCGYEICGPVLVVSCDRLDIAAYGAIKISICQ